MLVRISGEVKNYLWGSKSLIQNQFGIGEIDQPLAEVWFGTHPSGESKLIQSSEKLSDAISTKLTFLVKFLAAGSPLSIQVHPNSDQAKAGFEKENQLGLALDDPARNYRDEFHKPEILIALSPFRALCGFRPKSETLEILRSLSGIDPRFEELATKLENEGSLKNIFTLILNDDALATKVSSSLSSLQESSTDSPIVASAKSLLMELVRLYPSDTGVLVAMMLNLVELEPGQAIFLPAGNLHAYLSGLGLEVMASSDNVIRGGLTPKNVDKDELLAIAEFSELLNPLVATKKLAEGLVEYPVAASEFKVYRAEVSSTNLLADIDLPTGALIVCVSGEVAVSNSLEEREVLKRSEVFYLSEAKKFSLSGNGTAFVVLGSS